MDKISILLPIRPGCQTLRKTLESIVDQSYVDWELIALLDRDNGDSEKLIRATIEPAKLKILHVNYLTMGFPAILNLGIANANSEFVARFDDDDISSPHRLQTQMEIFYKYGEVDVVVSWAEVKDPEGKSLYWIKPELNSVDIEIQLLTVNIIAHSSVMFKKSTIESVGGYRNGLMGCEDYDLWLRLIGKGKFFGVQEKLITYLQNPHGMTKSQIPKESIKLLRPSRRNAQIQLNVGVLKSAWQRILWEKSQ